MAILELRAFAGAWDAVNNAKQQSDVPDTPMVDIVWDIRKQQMAEARANRLAKLKARGKA